MAHQSYLLLGEGDFTYSLDACRHLASLSVDGAVAEKEPSKASLFGAHVPSKASITCTGVDTLEELRGKYRDIDFVLRGIRSCHQRSLAGDARRLEMDVRIVHGVNAIQAECTDDDTISQPFDHVIFNHPHLGTEDAQLHSRFLCHLFHAAVQRWMKPRGLLHLTLVNGQCARWRCLGGAAKHGLQLLRRRAFRPPPPPMGEEAHYELRRHQSGRSFANRRRMEGDNGCGGNDSETLVFGRRDECHSQSASSSGEVANNVGLLPWESAVETCKGSNATAERSTDTSTAPPPAVDSDNPHACKYCTKSFPQHRSLKNHMICSHPECEEVRAWELEKGKRKKRRRKDRDAMQCNGVVVGDDDDTHQSTSDNDNAPRDENVTGPPWICTLCNPKKGMNRAASYQVVPAPRAFPHKQALLDHRRAKHHGAHLDIKPYWYRGGETGGEGKDDCSGASVGSCPICDAQYATEADKLRHEMEFVPSSSLASNKVSKSGDSNGSLYNCRHCSKEFRELRAQRQHENFCSRAE